MVDLRSRRAFAAGHLPGSLSFEYGDNLVANLGWLLPPGTPLTLIGESPGQVTDAQRDLTRIGVDRIAGMAGPPHEWREEAPHLASYPVADFPELVAMAREQPVAVLDVRRRLEWSAGHIEGALHVPLHQLPGRLPDLPADPIWVHCQAGYRASVAASILHAAGRVVTAIDDDFGNAARAGLTVTAAPAAAAAWARGQDQTVGYTGQQMVRHRRGGPTSAGATQPQPRRPRGVADLDVSVGMRPPGAPHHRLPPAPRSAASERCQSGPDGAAHVIQRRLALVAVGRRAHARDHNR